jgi:hypothetical protein
LENIPTKDSSRDELILGEMKSDDMILYLFSFWLSARHYLRVVEFNLKKFPAKTTKGSRQNETPNSLEKVPGQDERRVVAGV